MITLAQSLDFFPANYESAKNRFLSLAESFNDGEKKAILVGKENLSIDILYLPALKQQKKLVIITSGNHGAEAYVGSALQFLFLQEILPGLDRSQTGVLLIHSLNPWGFKHHRRGTENNVNLNRNFDLDKEIFQFKNSGYETVKDLLEYREVVTSLYTFPCLKLFWQMLVKSDVTQQSLTEAIGKGQYNYAQGINFGGFDFESQTLDIIKVLKNYAQNYSEILNIDLHTGLGERGVLHFMTKEDMSLESANMLKKIIKAEDKEYFQHTLPHAEGFYEIHGDYSNILKKILPNDGRIIIPITAEFGTMGNGLMGKIKTINRLILENQGYYFGYKNAAIEAQVKEDYLEIFFPSDLAWRQKVLRDGKYLLDVVLKRFITQ